MKSKSAFLLLVIFISFACASVSKKPAQLYGLEYKTIEFVKNNSSTPETECVKLCFSYPEVITQNNRLKDSLERRIKNFLLESMYPGFYLNSFEAFRDTVFKEVESFNTAYNETPMTYKLERDVKVELDSCGVVTLAMFHSATYSGNLPEVKTSQLSLDENGEVLTLENLFIKEYEEELSQIAEKVFRESKEINTDKSYYESGYYFVEDKFQLSEAFSIIKEGLRFQYKITELSTDDGTPVSFILPFSSVVQLAAKGSVIKNFIE